jgi:hypothetical protein
VGESKYSAAGESVSLVSHGFQTNYERGFTNGLAESGRTVTLISSDRTDYAGLRGDVQCLNLRGSQEECRPGLSKLFNMLCYHARLCAHAVWRRSGVLHVIGLIDPPFLVGILEGLWFRLVCRRYVLTVHDLLPHGRHTRWNKFLYHVSFCLPHHLVVHTERMREQLVERHGRKADQITVMQHASSLPVPPRLCV